MSRAWLPEGVTTRGRPRHWTPGAIVRCEREGHEPSPGLRHDLMGMAMVADCWRCGAVLMLDQTPLPVQEDSDDD